ncbi:hypothetical protein EZJ49_08440 [Bdellovibrio bacteriovorus]|uniref:hypothetical protein n=1 Tax=Bdellovibrio bacteriovorus TaxID=959 RepID=UPI0021D0B0F1|nr:hypothetical protein [Bdellovibrio bacteriovorus]UXR63103.1 hypothetical protein EZJ49_08440 [Bdellovibrio bacteriovorus]
MKLGGFKKTFAGVAIMAMVLGFQNCSDFALQDQVLYEQGLFDSQTALDQKALPKLTNVESDQLVFWSKPGNPSFVDKGIFYANQTSMVIAVDRSITGKIISVTSGANQEDAFISISGGKVRATHASTTSGQYTYMEANLPSLGERMIIAAGFGTKPTEISLLINGVVQAGTIQKVLEADSFYNSMKDVETGGTAGQIYEYVVYAGDSAQVPVLTKGELNVMSRYIATNNLIENVIFDPSLANEGKDGGAPENPKFAPVKSLLDAKCVTCHIHSSNLKNMTETKAIANNWVRAKNLAGSKLYTYLKGNSVNSSGTMPTDGTLSAAELQAVEDWINSIEN